MFDESINRINNKKRAFGICLGASTISAVEVYKKENGIKVERVILKAHEGNPKYIFQKVVEELNCNKTPTLVTGRKFKKFVQFPSITEPEAVEHALNLISNGKKYDALVSAGGETFMVYRLDENQRIAGISTGNKCASGTGEFFLQQIRRMNLKLEEAINVAGKGKPYAVSGRCSVFCKSDCTHALNKGEPIANVTCGLCKMIAQKILELLAKVPNEKILVVGGTALNSVVTNYLKRELKHVFIPEQAPYFEALGAAIAALEKGGLRPEKLFYDERSHFSFLPPLKEAEHLVTFNTTVFDTAAAGDECVIGLDVGSTTTKAIILRLSDNAMLGKIYLRTNGNPVEASRECYKSLLSQLNGTKIKIKNIGVTGSGRQIAGLYSLTDGIINEIIAHASAAVYFDPEVDTIFEIGGQDAKYTYITNSVASDYAMNEACSAGTGSFLEESAYETLGIEVEKIADLAIQGDRPPNFNDQCAAFISSDIKNATHEGISRENILAGLVYSICFNYINRVKGHKPVGKKIFVQGGVCYNRAVPLAMAAVVHKPIIVPPEPGLMGAFGVALEVKKRLEMGLLIEQDFDLEKLINRKVEYEKPFTCAGGKEKCDLKCSINRIRIEGKVYPFGGACNRYYNIRVKKKVDDDNLDLVQERTRLIFDKYTPPKRIKPDATVIGINKSFLTHWIFPLYYNFFTELGCKVVLPDSVIEEAFNRQSTSLCFPAQIALGYFEDLCRKNPDYYFMPHVKEMYVPNGNFRKEFSATCIFIQGEAFYTRNSFLDKDLNGKIISPTINFNGGWEKGRQVFIDVAKRLGFSKEKADKAFSYALNMQGAYESELKEIGRKALEKLRQNPDKYAIILFGRPYNAFAIEANKGIPKKLTSRGAMVIPFDMLPFEKEELGEDYREYMHWALGNKIIRAAQILKREPQLFGVYITNFLCAIDSLLVTYFRKIMGTKPSLTLELDGHTADAGIDTRIEAYYDIIHNYRQLQEHIKDRIDKHYRPARIDMGKNGTFFIDSKGKRFPLKDPNIKLILTAMNDLGNKAFAAVFRYLGINAEALPTADNEALQLGRSVTTCKECLPMIICIGSMLKYLKYRKNPDEKLVVFQPRAAGYCRLGQYHSFMNLLIKERKLKDVALISLANEERYAGLGPLFAYKSWQAIVFSDVFDDMRGAIWALAEDTDAAMKTFYEEFYKIVSSIEGLNKVPFYRQLRQSAKRLKTIPLKQPLKSTPVIMIMGEIFVRKDIFSNLYIARRIAKRGFVPLISPIHEWIYYLNYKTKHGLQTPEYNSFLGWIEFYLSDLTQRYHEKKIKTILSASGLYSPEIIDVADMLNYSKHVIPLSLDGEPGMISGVTLRDSMSKYAGIVNIGPFSCMPVRFTESVMVPITDIKAKAESYKQAGRYLDTKGFSLKDRIPFLTIEADGNPYPQLLEARFESFCLQAARVGEKLGQKTSVL
jgi:predicted CoA-substrate-specific enzyme activase